MKRIITAAAMASLIFSASASAQTAKLTRERVLGCVDAQVYNTQSIKRQGMSFVIVQDEEPHVFNFEGDAIRFIPIGTATPIALAEEVGQYKTLIDSIERATAANRPLTVDYTMPDRKVFGITINWGDFCPSS
ncbi:MAG: hypothetical protein AAGH41_02085 [Pseudomonadota bacterium]